MKHSLKKDFRTRIISIYFVTFVTIAVVANIQYFSLVEHGLVDYNYFTFIAKPLIAFTVLIFFIYLIIDRMFHRWILRIIKFENFINSYLQKEKFDDSLFQDLQDYDDDIAKVSKNIHELMKKNITVLDRQKRFIKTIEELNEIILGLDSNYIIFEYNKPWLQLKSMSDDFIDYLNDENIKKFLLGVDDLKSNSIKNIIFVDSLTTEESFFEVKIIYVNHTFGVIVRDISFTYKKHQEIKYMALHDGLTGLPNRELFMDRFNSEIKKAHRESKKFALLFFDLNNFKAVNDNYGHEMGDAVLIEFAKRLSLTTRESDTVARWGGDEFLAVLSNMNDREIKVVIDKISQHLEEPVIYNNHSINLKTSIGVSYFPEDGETPDSLISKADKAMYKSKKSKLSYCEYKQL